MKALHPFVDVSDACIARIVGDEFIQKQARRRFSSLYHKKVLKNIHILLFVTQMKHYTGIYETKRANIADK